MPNRILKQSICTSSNINALSFQAEAFFCRLLVQCDDYGTFHANPAILRAMCFPLRLHQVSEADAQGWLDELIRARLVWLYESEGVSYLQVTKWKEHQQIRAQKRKFPAPPANPPPWPPPASNGNQLPAPDSNGNHLISDDINGNQVIAIAPVIQSNPIQSKSEDNGADAPDDSLDLPLEEQAADEPSKPETRSMATGARPTPSRRPPIDEKTHGHALLRRLTESYAKVGRAPPKTYPSVEMQDAFETVIGQLGPDFEAATTKAFEKGITALPKLLDWYRGWMRKKNANGTNTNGHGPANGKAGTYIPPTDWS